MCVEEGPARVRERFAESVELISEICGSVSFCGENGSHAYISCIYPKIPIIVVFFFPQRPSTSFDPQGVCEDVQWNRRSWRLDLLCSRPRGRPKPKRSRRRRKRLGTLEGLGGSFLFGSFSWEDIRWRRPSRNVPLRPIPEFWGAGHGSEEPLVGKSGDFDCRATHGLKSFLPQAAES